MRPRSGTSSQLQYTVPLPAHRPSIRTPSQYNPPGGNPPPVSLYTTTHKGAAPYYNTVPTPVRRTKTRARIKPYGASSRDTVRYGRGFVLKPYELPEGEAPAPSLNRAGSTRGPLRKIPMRNVRKTPRYGALRKLLRNLTESPYIGRNSGRILTPDY